MLFSIHNRVKNSHAGKEVKMRRQLRFDIWLCGLLSLLAAYGTGYIASQFSNATYDDYAQSRVVADGETGGLAGEDIPRAMSIKDLLDYDRFTISIKDKYYFNDGVGFYNGMTLINLELPSGERVAALINSDNIQQEAGSALDEIILPVGCVVYEDLTQSEDILAQIEYGYSLSRRDFYVDMKGEGGTASKEERSSSFTGITQFITFIICFPIFHALGSRLGVFPYFFPPE